MKKLLTLSVLSSLAVLAGCGHDHTLERVVEQSTQTVQLPPLVQDEVAQVLEEENAYRLAAGQAPLTPGLTCTLHNLAATTPAAIPVSPPAAVATFVYQGSFNQADGPASDGLSVLPAALRPLYTQWFLVKCSGQLIVPFSGHQAFTVRSDDGSKLYLGGTAAGNLVVNGDGNHAPTNFSGSRLLKRGIVSVQLQYMQATGMQALVVSDQDGVIAGSRFVR